MIDTLTTIISSQMYINQNVQIKTNSIEANYLKANVSTINTQQSFETCQINIPSFCNDLLAQIQNCASMIITQKVI